LRIFAGLILDTGRGATAPAGMAAQLARIPRILRGFEGRSAGPAAPLEPGFARRAARMMAGDRLGWA